MNFAKSGSETIAVQWRIDQWFPEIPEETRLQFKKYHEELLRSNKLVNLIGVKSIPNADAVHFADCILATRVIEGVLSSSEVYDFGSGGGFPGLIAALLLPDTKFHLVEVDPRKAEYLKHMVSFLGLKNADVLIRSVDTLAKSSIKCAISRDFFSLSKALLMTRRQFAVGGVYFHLKGEEWATEISDIPTQLCSYWLPSLAGEYKLPVGEVRYAVVKTEKVQD